MFILIDYNTAVEIRKELNDLLEKLDRTPEHKLMEESSKILQGSYKESRDALKSELERVYESHVIERELVNLKKTPREKAVKLLETELSDINRMPLENLILYVGKCKKAKARLEEVLSVRMGTDHKDWKMVIEAFPPSKKLVASGGTEKWELNEPILYVSPVYPLVEGAKPANLCPHLFCDKAERNKDVDHINKFIHVCRYGVKCRDLDKPEHRKNYVHFNKPLCKDTTCNNCSSLHRAEYSHPNEWDYLMPCRHQQNCNKVDLDHKKKYSHDKPCFPSVLDDN